MDHRRELCSEIFDVWLRGGEAHGIPTLLALSILPEWLVFETVIQAGKGKSTEWEKWRGTPSFFSW